VLSDRFKSYVEILRTIIDEEDYYLGWVFLDGQKYLAEISKGYNGGIPAGEWLKKEGILQPETFEKSDDGVLILYFSVPSDFQLMTEIINDTGGMQEETTILLGIRLARLLKTIHESGHRVGYLGPENVFLAGNGQPYLLAGARGVPDSHFSPPEAIGVEPEDPRSDIYALGLLMFRGIAGTDDEDEQKEVWNDLSEPILNLFTQMADPDISKRFPNFKILLDRLQNLRTLPPGESSESKWIPTEHIHRKKEKKKNRYLWIPGILLFIFLLYMLFCTDADHTEGTVPAPVGQDSAGVGEQVDEIETVEEVVEPIEPLESIEAYSPVIWVTNGTGIAGLAGEFRDSNALSFTDVTACTGMRRNASKIVVRREAPGVSISSSLPLQTAVNTLNNVEPPMPVHQVDITILIGNDLMFSQSSGSEIFTPVNPEDTLCIDLANHDIIRRPNAASWTKAAIDGKSVLIDGTEWLIEVIDFRDGDNYTAEIDIPNVLDLTVFLYDREYPTYASAEGQIRTLILNPSSIGNPGSSEDYSSPDIWVFLGR